MPDAFLPTSTAPLRSGVAAPERKRYAARVLKAMKRLLVAAIAILTFAGSCLIAYAQAQSGTEAEIVFASDLEERAREQLRRILARYDVDSWIFTREVRMEAGAEPHSMPVLTLNTDFLDDDEMQLSIFLHEQAHWFVYRATGRDAAVEELRKKYPAPPRADYRTYQHLLVAWVELDAMVELIGEEKARQKLVAKVQRLTAEVTPEVGRVYSWYNGRVLEDTDEIGDIVARHGMIITPQKGLIVQASEK
jgi:hypothetical protein